MSDWITWNAPYTGWAVMLLLAVIGLAIAIRGIRRRPPRTDTGHCARCGYDLHASPGDRCSECGGKVGDNAPRLPRRWRWVSAGVVLAISLPLAVIAKRVNEYGLKYYGYCGPLYWVLPDETVEELAHGDYVIRLSRDRYSYSSNDRTLTICTTIAAFISNTAGISPSACTMPRPRSARSPTLMATARMN